MIKKIITLSKYFWSKRLWVFFYSFLFWIYWMNTFHTRFPDELDNIVGGWYINRGIRPYTGFFSHHNPGAYTIASFITLFTRQSFVNFRIGWAILLYLTAIVSFIFLRTSLGKETSKTFLIFMVVWAIAATYSWGQMMLSETIVGFMFVPVYLYVFYKYLLNKPINLRDVTALSALTAIAILTSFTYIFSISILIGLILYMVFRSYGIFSRTLIKTLVIFALPYILFLGYLISSRSLSEFYFQSIVYNRDYYIYNFPLVSGQVSKNPVRYAISIFYNTSNQFYALLQQVKDFNFAYPVNITLAVINFGLLIYLISKKKYLLAVFVYSIMVYLNARSQPLDSRETDFHSTVYVMFSLCNLPVIFYLLIHEFDKSLSYLRKVIYTSLLIIVGVYAIFTSLYFTRSFVDKVYTKFMGQAPAIYDEPVVAPIINKLVGKNDYFWIGPFAFDELLYINGKLPSKYHWFLPANERSEKIRTEIIADLTRNRPKIIVFQDNVRFFGTEPSAYNYPIVNFLKENYIRVMDLVEAPGGIYKENITDLHNYSVKYDFYFDKNREKEIVDLMLEKGVIKKIN